MKLYSVRYRRLSRESLGNSPSNQIFDRRFPIKRVFDRILKFHIGFSVTGISSGFVTGDLGDEWRSHGHSVTGESASKAVQIAVLSLRPQTEANLAI